MLQYYYNMAIKGKEGERLREKEQKWRQKRFFWKEKEKRNEILEGEKKKILCMSERNAVTKLETKQETGKKNIYIKV